MYKWRVAQCYDVLSIWGITSLVGDSTQRLKHLIALKGTKNDLLKFT